MRYIQKSENPPLDFEQWKADNKSIIDKKIKSYKDGKTTSGAVWDEFKAPEKDIFVEILLKEQGYVCAYCGSRIDFSRITNARGNFLYRVRLDHVDPKSMTIEKVFDYYNLVAACTGGEYHWHTISQGETLKTIAEMYGTTVEAIESLNSELYFDKGENLEIHIGTNKEIKIESHNPHCDVAKKNTPHPTSPLQPDCQEKFKYSSDGKIEFVEQYKEEVNDKNQTTIDILGLNGSKFLIEKRKKCLFSINAYVKNFKDAIILKQALIKRKEKLYINKEKLPEMVFVEEYFLNTFLSKKS